MKYIKNYKLFENSNFNNNIIYDKKQKSISILNINLINIDKLVDYINDNYEIDISYDDVYNEIQFCDNIKDDKIVEAILNSYKVYIFNKNNLELYNEVLIDRSKIKYGISDNFKTTFYILEDGTLLNGSYNGYSRDIDHREINTIMNDFYSDDFGIKKEDFYFFISFGNISIGTNYFRIGKKPTNEQIISLNKLFEYVLNKYDSIEIMFLKNKLSDSDKKEYFDTYEIIDDILNYNYNNF